MTPTPAAARSAVAPEGPGDPVLRLPPPRAVMRQAGQENFTVASVLLGAAARRHLLAIYGFARLVDDVGDEAAGDRLALLDEVERELATIYAGGDPSHPLMAELAGTVRACGLPDGPFQRLIAANRQDQFVMRYDTFEDLLRYCDLSAAPVGELVLHVFGCGTPERIALSDRVCAGLQIVEHLQDLEEDLDRGRVYVPQEDLDRFGCSDRDLAGPPTPRSRALVAFVAARARRLLREGAPLARTLPPRPRAAVAGFVAGGRAALDALVREAPRSPSAFARAYADAIVGR